MKELQGQFKTDFENWLISHEINQDVFQIDSLSGYFSGDLHDVFYRLPICAQFGIVQLFADSVMFDLQEAFNNEEFMQAHQSSGSYFDRSEAQQEAITQFEKWYNENK